MATSVLVAEVYLESDGCEYGKLNRGNGGGEPAFNDGQRGGFVNGWDERHRCEEVPDAVCGVPGHLALGSLGEFEREGGVTGVGGAV